MHQQRNIAFAFQKRWKFNLHSHLLAEKRGPEAELPGGTGSLQVAIGRRNHLLVEIEMRSVRA